MGPYEIFSISRLTYHSKLKLINYHLTKINKNIHIVIFVEKRTDWKANQNDLSIMYADDVWEHESEGGECDKEREHQPWLYHQARRKWSSQQLDRWIHSSEPSSSSSGPSSWNFSSVIRECPLPFTSRQFIMGPSRKGFFKTRSLVFQRDHFNLNM